MTLDIWISEQGSDLIRSSVSLVFLGVHQRHTAVWGANNSVGPYRWLWWYADLPFPRDFNKGGNAAKWVAGCEDQHEIEEDLRRLSEWKSIFDRQMSTVDEVGHSRLYCNGNTYPENGRGNTNTRVIVGGWKLPLMVITSTNPDIPVPSSSS